MNHVSVPLSTPSARLSDAYVEGMQFNVLGTVEVVEDGRRLSLGGVKQRTVLGLLIANAGTSVSADRLIESTWGEDAPDGARRSLQTYISNLRQLEIPIDRDGRGYRLAAERSEIDALWFEDEVLTAQAMGAEPEVTAEQLRDALALWRGHPYDDVDGGPELISEVARLYELRLAALGARIDADLDTGLHREIIGELDALTVEYPLREGFRAQQMVALFRAGRQAEALRGYQKTRTYLVDELGIDPSPELRDLEQRILDQDQSLLLGPASSIVRRAVLVADIGTDDGLGGLAPAQRHLIVDGYGEALDTAVGAAGGAVFAQRGSATYAVFDDALGAVSAAEATQRAVAGSGLDGPGLRMAIDAGDVEARGDDHEVSGPPISRSAGLVAAAWGGQVLLSSEMQAELAASGEAGFQIRALGRHTIRGLGERAAVYELVVPGLDNDFVDLRINGTAPGLPSPIRGLPGYEFRDVVGRGSFGVVHRGYQPSVGREVAIKVIRPDLANEPDFIRLFEVEAQLIARLEHPHIVPLYDYWRDPEGAYLVMRWIRGGTLGTYLQDHGPLSLDAAAELMTQLAPALDVAHRAGIIHRDIKPSNVLLDEDGNAYLSDFGIAYDAITTRSGELVLDPRTDVAGLGSLLIDSLGSSPPEPIVAVLETATADRAGNRYATIEDFAAAWEAALTLQGVATEPSVFTLTRNPYKGLRAFGELDADDFFGREDEVEEVVRTLQAQRMVAVVGPSGIGKSSVVRAGMVPALREGAIDGSADWLITDMLPGPYPYEELASALIRVASAMPTDLEDELRRDPRGLARAAKRYVPEGQTAVLIIDQFEELFTLAGDDDRRSFLAMLAETVADDRANVRIVVTMRADYFDRPLRFAELGDALRNGTVPISAPPPNALDAIITQPAANVGVLFEPGLIDRITAAVADQAGALPLLEYALTELFDERSSDQLTVASYESTGGVHAALGRRAETTFLDLGGEAQTACRQVFLRLVNVAEGGRDTRRRVRVADLERLGFSDMALRGVLRAFGEYRLLTFDRDPITRSPTVEVAHEAILTDWARLAEWIADQREDLLLHSRLAVAVADWEHAQHAETYLITAGRLEQHEAWTTDTELSLTSAEHEFLATSRDAENQRRTQRRRSRRLIMTGFAAAALVAALLAVAALVAAERAGVDASLARARELTAKATGVLESDPELSGLLALEAVEAFEASGDIPGDAVTALRNAIVAQRVTFRVPGGRFVAVHPDGSQLATKDGTGVAVWDISTGEVVERYSRGSAESAEATFSPNGDLLAVYFEGVDPPVTIWNRASGNSFELGTGLVTDLPGVRFSDAGNLIALASFTTGVEVWSVEDRRKIMEAEGLGVAFAASGLLSYGHCTENGDSAETCEVRIVDPESGQLVRSFPSEVKPSFTDWSPDESRIVAADQNTAVVHDAVTGAVISRTDIDRVFAPRWLPASDAFVIGGETVPRVIDATTGAVLTELQGQAGGSWALEVMPGGTFVASGGLGDDTVIFDISPLAGLELGGWIAPVETTWHAMFSPLGHRAVIADWKTVVTANALDGSDAVVMGGKSGEWFPVPSRDGSLVPVVEADGSWAIRRTDTTEIVYRAPDGWSIHGIHAESLKAVIFREKEPGRCQVRLVSMADASMPIELAAGCLGKVEFSPNGALAVTHNLDDFVLPYGAALFDTQTGELVSSFEDPFDGVVADFTPDGTKLVIIGDTGTLGLFEVSALLSDTPIEEAPLLVIPAHDGIVANLKVSPDGSMVITSTRNDSMKLWSLETGELLSQFGGDLEPGTRDVGAFHPTEPWLLVASPPNLVRIHTLDVNELVEIARARFTREMSDGECQLYLREACGV